MPSLAASRRLDEKFNFIVNVDGMSVFKFEKCSELTREVAKIEYWEGGALIPVKWPGRATVSDVTLTRGVGTEVEFDTWARQVVDPALAGGIGAGQNPIGFSRNMVISQRDRTKLVSNRKWNIYGAFPVKFTGGEWDNTVDEVVIETLVLAIDNFALLVPTPTTIRLTGV